MLSLFTEVLLPSATDTNTPDIFHSLHHTHSQTVCLFALLPNHCTLGLVSTCVSRRELSTVCTPERVWCIGALVRRCSVPWCRLEQGSHVDTAARPICASHTVTITELLTSGSHIAVKPLTMPHAPIPKLMVL